MVNWHCCAARGIKQHNTSNDDGAGETISNSVSRKIKEKCEKEISAASEKRKRNCWALSLDSLEVLNL